jgi:hypothetical protein
MSSTARTWQRSWLRRDGLEWARHRRGRQRAKREAKRKLDVPPVQEMRRQIIERPARPGLLTRLFDRIGRLRLGQRRQS